MFDKVLNMPLNIISVLQSLLVRKFHKILENLKNLQEAARKCSVKKVSQNLLEKTGQGFLISNVKHNAFNFTGKRITWQVVSCEFCKTLKANLKHMQKQPLVRFYKKVVLKNFAIFTVKHLCWSLFLIKLQGSILKNICERLLLQMHMNDCSWWVGYMTVIE